MTTALTETSTISKPAKASMTPMRRIAVRRTNTLASEPAQKTSKTMTQFAPTPNSPVLSPGTNGAATNKAARPAQTAVSRSDVPFVGTCI